MTFGITTGSGTFGVAGGFATFSTSTADTLGVGAVQVPTAASYNKLIFSTTFNMTSTQLLNDAGFALFGQTPTFDFFQAGNSHYIVDFKVDGSFRLLKNTGPLDFTTLIPTTFGSGALNAGTPYEFTVEATKNGGSLDFLMTLVDLNTNTTLFSGTATDPSPLTGTYFGLRNRSSFNTAYTVNHDNFSIIPEPSSAVLLVMGLCGLGLFRRRKA
jgi:hypothetical protein